MKVDYIIVGQGLCGTLLSRRLINAGKSVVVIDNGNPAAAGRVAGGIINPVTGKRLVRTWLIEELLPFAITEYSAIEQECDASIVSPCNILDFHYTREAQTSFNEKTITEKQYLSISEDEAALSDYFRFNYGVGSINQCLLVDLHMLLHSWQQQLQSKGAMLHETFEMNHCTFAEDAVIYKDITADRILFCDGTSAIDNPFFEMLPWSKDKGEALIVSIPDLPRNNIYKQGISIVPWQEDLFWVGASHDWKYTTTERTPEFRNRVSEQLDYWLKLPYTVVDHITAMRPANFDRKPFIGMHPKNQRVGIFNGMGGKGCSLAPYFARQFADHLTQGTPLMPDLGIQRYARILGR